jgi:quercetin dioxygenase-like cupin family protein
MEETKFPYPEMITNLPEIDIPIDGIRGWLLRNDTISAVFFELDPIGKIPDHDHCAQWGMVIEGKMRFTIGGETKIYTRGDRYFIPEGVVHSAEFLTKCYVIDYFDDPNRYQEKKK